MTTIDPRWRKSSRSGPQSECVEVHAELDAVRDSKNPGPTLTGQITALVTAVKAGSIRA